MDTSQGRNQDGRQPVGGAEAATTDLARLSALWERAAASFARRTQHAQHSELFSARELERLRFIRWLYQTGRLAA